MNTKKHAEIAQVGEQLLKDALKRAGRGEMRIAAFEMGNWLTDVAQCVEPVGYRSAHKKIMELLTKYKPQVKANALIDKMGNTVDAVNDSVTALFRRFLHDSPGWISETLGDAKGELEELRTGINNAYMDLLSSLDPFFKEEGRLFNAVHAAFGFMGYLKFVFAKEGSWTNYRMDPACYFQVFDKWYTQYFPHEHLDRPAVAKDKRENGAEYPIKKADGPLNKKAQKRAKTSLGANGSKKPAGDLYEYLRENIQTVAGLFALLDNGPVGLSKDEHGWATATFNKNLKEFTTADDDGSNKRKHPVDDKDPAWNMHLALLGNALHTVEDYFAHSTFVEQASGAIPTNYARFARLEDKAVGLLARRLKEWTQAYYKASGDNWKDLKPETHVVSGYFDIQDTLISITHMANALFGDPVTTVGYDADKAVERLNKGWKEAKEYDYAKLFRDTVELYSDPKKVWSRNNPAHPSYKKDDQNLAVKWLRQAGGKDLQMAEGSYPKINDALDVILTGPLDFMEPEAKKYFRTAVESFTKTIGVVRMGYSLYSVAKNVAAFVKDPIAWLGGWIEATAIGYLKKKISAYEKDLVWAYFGARRVGCHSLINKDSGPELFFDAALECAKATHWYVVHTLLRHSRETPAKVKTGTDQGEPSNVLIVKNYIDWLELLEYFLDHPFAMEEIKIDLGEFSGPIIHYTRPGEGSTMSCDSLRLLAEEARLSFAAPLRLRASTSGGEVCMSPSVSSKVPKMQTSQEPSWLTPATAADEPLWLGGSSVQSKAPWLAAEKASLVNKVPTTAAEYTWMTIADANFPGVAALQTENEKKLLVNKILKESGTGIRVKDKINYAFKPGLRLIIPYQKIQLPFITASLERRWWYPVIVGSRKHESVADWFDKKTGSRLNNAPAHAHRVTPSTQVEHDELIKKATLLRMRLEKEFNDQAPGFFTKKQTAAHTKQIQESLWETSKWNSDQYI